MATHLRRKVPDLQSASGAGNKLNSVKWLFTLGHLGRWDPTRPEAQLRSRFRLGPSLLVTPL